MSPSIAGDEGRGHLHGPLHLVRADEETAEEHGSRNEPERVQGAQEGGHDAREAVVYPLCPT